jgi:hypothetical protein
MGASEWGYFVPYQQDIEKALQDLRELTFANGDYSLVPPYWRTMAFEDFIPPDPSLSDEDIAEYRAEYDAKQALKEPTTIEELIQWNAEDGTHSIIDMRGVSVEAELFNVAPLTETELKSFFGTSQPMHEIIIKRERDLQDFLQLNCGRRAWMGTYIVVFEDGKPAEIYFTGYSGD